MGKSGGGGGGGRAGGGGGGGGRAACSGRAMVGGGAKMSSSKPASSAVKASNSKSTSAQVHRANQLNPCHALFHQSRGLSASAAKEAAQAAAQSAKKAAVQPTSQDTNRANQLNPFHEAFWKSRRIEPGKVEMVYHGTSKESADAILKKGFNPSKDGLLGRGVYVTTDLGKAQAFAGSDGRILRAAANLGSLGTVDARQARQGGYSETAWQRSHDAAYVPQGEGVARPEHCVKDPARVERHMAGGVQRSNLLWSLAKVLVKEETLMEQMAAMAIPQMADFTPQALANRAWSSSTLSVSSPAVMKATAAAALPKLSGFSFQGLCNLAWASSTLAADSPLWDALWKRLQDMDLQVSELQLNQVTTLAASFSTMGRHPPPVVAAWAERALEQLQVNHPSS
eukprot:s473_g14.t1